MSVEDALLLNDEAALIASALNLVRGMTSGLGFIDFGASAQAIGDEISYERGGRRFRLIIERDDEDSDAGSDGSEGDPIDSETAARLGDRPHEVEEP